MKIGFLFPGQGTQNIGMGKDFYEKYEEAREIYDKVKELTNIDIAKISFEGPEELLNKTSYTQLAVLTNSLAILAILKKKKIQAEISAGLSLGEYAALIYSGAIRFEEGIKLVQKRGEYMEKLLPKGEWQMAAIIGLAQTQVEKICQQITKGFIAVANYNCEEQIVLSGEKDAILEAEEIAKAMGAKKIRVLKTAGPFHTEKLKESSIAYAKELEKIKINSFTSEVIKNLDGTPYNSKDNIKEILEKHIICPVQFTKIIQTMLKQEIDIFIEIGPRKNFIWFCKKNKNKQRDNNFKYK